MSNFGFGIGLEFRESNLIINQKNDNILKENMVFNICISANDLFDQTKN
jgi:nucleosome binding factor SPN SPT16 subunit